MIFIFFELPEVVAEVGGVTVEAAAEQGGSGGGAGRKRRLFF